MFTPSHRESEFISVSRLLMIAGLVYHHLFEIPGSTHSPRLNMENYTSFFPDFINSFFHMAFMTAVPVLSVISGFLFFHRPEMQYGELLRRRLFSVAFPTWIWSALWLLFALFLYSWGSENGWFRWSDYGFESLSAMTLVNGIFGVTREPFAFQFWFVHDLLLTLLLTPLLSFFLRRLGWRLLVLMAAIWLAVPYPPIFFSGNVLMFFAVGAWLGMPQGPGLAPLLLRLQAYRWLLLALFSVILTARIMSHEFGVLDAALQSYAYLCLLRITGVLTAAALLYHMIVRMPRITSLILPYSAYSFFIFASHFPLIELLQEAVPLVPGYDTALGLCLSWFFIPLFTLTLTIAIARFCEEQLPKVFAVLNGGRKSALRHTTQAFTAPYTP